MALKWGIAAAGLICHDFVNAVGTLSKDDHQVVAVAARDLSRSKEFAARFEIPKAYSSYLELAQDPEVEIVYIGVLIPQHMEVSMLMLDHGKHVLCEKPLCLNEGQVRKLTSYAKQKKLFFMEGLWTRMFPSYQYIRQQIDSGKLGEIQEVDVIFGDVELSKLDRLTKKKFGGSVTTDMGVYPILLCQWVFHDVEPKSIKATGTLNDDGVDIEVNAELNYGDNKVAKIKLSILSTFGNVAKIIGTKGQITIPNPARCPPTIIDVDGKEKTWPLPKAKLEFNCINSCGLRYEADEVRKCIRSGKTECEFATYNASIIIARIEDEIRHQIGNFYSEDQ